MWSGSASGSLQSKKIYQNFLVSTGNTIPVAKYGNLYVVLGNVDNTSIKTAQFQFIDSSSGFIIDEGLLSCPATSGPHPVWSLPVISDTFKLTNTIGNQVIGAVIGTNDQSTSRRMQMDLYPARRFTVSIPASTPNQTKTAFTAVDTGGGLAFPLYTTYNGQVMYELIASQTISCSLVCRYIDGTGAQIDSAVTPVTSLTSSRILGTIGHPYAYVQWLLLTEAVSPATATTVNLSIIPQSPSG